MENVKFLGAEIHLCEKSETMVARFPSSKIKLLSFYVTELSRSYKLLNNITNKLSLDLAFRSASQSVACLVESAIQYLIFFLDEKSMITAYNIHRRAVCALSGKSFRFFGFKTKTASSENFIDDTFDFFIFPSE